MKPETTQPESQDIDYPDSDGQPMADNTQQFRAHCHPSRATSTLSSPTGPTSSSPATCSGMPSKGTLPSGWPLTCWWSFGRPKGDRGSYKQWEEGGIAPQVVWEVLSPGNTAVEMTEKRDFYQRHGVVEYYEYDPDRGLLRGWLRNGDVLEPVPQMQGHTSPLLSVRMVLDELEDLVLYRPDGTRFLSFMQLDAGFREAREIAAA